MTGHGSAAEGGQVGGHSTHCKGPYGGFPEGWLEGATHLVMLGAGTGITPMLQVIYGLTEGPKGSTRSKGIAKVDLLVINRREEDIPMKPHLKALADPDNGVEVCSHIPFTVCE